MGRDVGAHQRRRRRHHGGVALRRRHGWETWRQGIKPPTHFSHRFASPSRSELHLADAGSSDRDFAEKVGSERGSVLPFLTPEVAFGPSVGGRKATPSFSVEATPELAIRARRAWLGSYLSGPIVLMLCGVQGSGKSFACEELLAAAAPETWVVACQDTISNGAAGKCSCTSWSLSCGLLPCRQARLARGL